MVPMVRKKHRCWLERKFEGGMQLRDSRFEQGVLGHLDADCKSSASIHGHPVVGWALHRGLNGVPHGLQVVPQNVHVKQLSVLVDDDILCAKLQHTTFKIQGSSDCVICVARCFVHDQISVAKVYYRKASPLHVMGFYIGDPRSVLPWMPTTQQTGGNLVQASEERCPCCSNRHMWCQRC